MSALRVRNLRKAYKDVVAVDGLELEVRSGECFGCQRVRHTPLSQPRVSLSFSIDTAY